MKRKNITLILILIILSIFLVQYCSKQERIEKERLEKIEKVRTEKEQKEKERLKKIEKVRTEKEQKEKERLEKIEKERIEKEQKKKAEKKKAKKKESPPIWYTDVNKAINTSVQSGKPLFFFFTGSDWCGWCKRLQREVFFKPEFTLWANKNVVLVELDFPRRTKLPKATQKQNRELAQLFGVRGYPTVWLVTPTKVDGKVNFNKLGSQGYVAGGPSAWIAGANKIIKSKK